MSALLCDKDLRQAFHAPLELGAIRIEDIQLNHQSRDDIPALLIGLQYRYAHVDFRQRLVALLDEHLLPGVDKTVGRPGMERWKILVMGVVKQGPGCDFDRLHERVNEPHTLRQCLGRAKIWANEQYEYRTMVDNVCLLRPEWLARVNDLIVESGHKGAGKKPGAPLRGRRDSFVVETDVHYPTKVNLRWDAMRGLIRTTGRAAVAQGVPGWRQMDPVDCRLLQGETIPQEEQVFSIFAPHPRIQKGKAGCPVALGVPGCVIEDPHGFVLHHRVMREGSDVDYAVPMVEAAQVRFPDLRAVSFERGFHSRGNRVRLDALLDPNVWPQKGGLSQADREREQGEAFVAMRRQHPGVASAINHLEPRGLNRVLSLGADGLARTVALSVVALNIHRIGLRLRRKEPLRTERRRKRRRRAA